MIPISEALFDLCLSWLRPGTQSLLVPATLPTGEIIGIQVSPSVVGFDGSFASAHSEVSLLRNREVCRVRRRGAQLQVDYFVWGRPDEAVSPAFHAASPRLFATGISIVDATLASRSARASAHRASLRGDQDLLKGLMAIATLLTPIPVRPGVLAEVNRFVDNPDTWIATRHGLVDAHSVAWPALVDILVEHRVAAVIDWRSTEDELRDEVGRLVASYGLDPASVTARLRDDRTASENMRLASRAARKLGRLLVDLTPETDTFTTVCVNLAALRDFDELVRACDGRISTSFE